MRNRLVIMAKAPVMGRVKTRLGRDVGAVAATRFCRVALARLLRKVDDPRWETVLAVAPDDGVFWPWPGRARLVAQGPGDLGARMQRLFDHLPPGPVVIIGSDIPAITKNDIAAAFAELGRHDAAIGPAPDGGYWLIGLRRRPHVPRAFPKVRWSTPHAMADTMAALAPLRVARLAEHEDVDDAAAYLQWRKGEAASGG